MVAGNGRKFNTTSLDQPWVSDIPSIGRELNQWIGSFHTSSMQERRGGGETRGKRDFSAGATRGLGGKERQGRDFIVISSPDLSSKESKEKKRVEWG